MRIISVTLKLKKMKNLVKVYNLFNGKEKAELLSANNNATVTLIQDGEIVTTDASLIRLREPYIEKYLIGIDLEISSLKDNLEEKYIDNHLDLDRLDLEFNHLESLIKEAKKYLIW